MLTVYMLIVKIMFHSYFERQTDEVLISDNVHFPGFEITASL